MRNKLVSLMEAIKLCGIEDGMCLSFHHHLRNGDRVMAMVLRAIAELGIKDIRLATSSMMDGMVGDGIAEMMDNGTITGIDCNNPDKVVGRLVSAGKLQTPMKLRTHGGRPRAIMEGDIKIDVAFVAASAADDAGNCNGFEGANPFGSIGYSMTDTRYAKKVVVITDTLFSYPLRRASISETVVDYVVKVDAIGDPSQIATGIIKMEVRDPIALALAGYAAKAIRASGLFKDGMSFQSGASGAAIAVAKYLKGYMKQDNVHGSYILGGASSLSVELVEEGYFDTILDVQTFDQPARESIKNNAWHREISDSEYANPICGSCAVDRLDAAVLGALQVDTDFNVNVCVNSLGYLSGGSGGHTDIAARCKMSVVLLPTNRGRFPSIVEKVDSVTTPGKDIDVVVSQLGIAVNPLRTDLIERFKDAKLPMMSIGELQKATEEITGRPNPIRYGDRLVAEIIHRDGYVIDRVYNRIPD